MPHMHLIFSTMLFLSACQSTHVSELDLYSKEGRQQVDPKIEYKMHVIVPDSSIQYKILQIQPDSSLTYPIILVDPE